MTQSRFSTREVRNFTSLLYALEEPGDIYAAKRVLGRHCYGIRAIISSSSSKQEFSPYDATSLIETEYLVSYLRGPYIYFINHEALERPYLRVSPTIVLDTNMASYIGKFIRGESLGQQQREVEHTVDTLLRTRLNFDHSFYIIENIKQAHPITVADGKEALDSPMRFWGTLEEGFRRNLIALELFKEMDFEYYIRTAALRFSITEEEAVLSAAKNAYRFYASTEMQDLVEEFRFLQKAILYQLLTMLKIQFSSHRSANNKIREFMEFAQENGAFFQRETILAHKYFKNHNAVPILKGINRGKVQRDLSKKIDNIAWDMTVPRYIERMIGLWDITDFILPFFMSFDRDLRAMISYYQVRGVIIDRESTGVLPIPAIESMEYFKIEGCEDILKHFFSEEMRAERHLHAEQTFEDLVQKVELVYQELAAILGSSS